MREVGVTQHGPVIAFTRGRSTTQWGVVALIVSESMLFLLLLAVYLYYRGAPGPWPPTELPLPDVGGSIVRAAVLLLGSARSRSTATPPAPHCGGWSRWPWPSGSCGATSTSSSCWPRS